MKPITSILIAGLIFIALQLSGQALITNFTPATVTSPIGSQVTLQFKVTNFTNITAVQFPIKYNQTALQFVSVNNFALPDLVGSNFNSIPAQGVVRFSWNPDPVANPNGVTVPAGTTIFTITFNLTTGTPSTVNLVNSASGFGIEVVRLTTPIQVDFQNGGASITPGTNGGGGGTNLQVAANTIFIPKDSVRCMPVTANNFTNMVSMDYAMHWNTSVLQYVNTKAYGIDFLAANDFSVPATPPGTLLLQWENENPAVGITRPNGHKLYEVCFRGIGNAGTNSLVNFDGVGFGPGTGAPEAMNTAGQNVWGAGSGITDTLFVTAPPPPNTSVTFTADRDTVGTGAQTCMDVKVRNFVNIISFQYALNYDATKLQYQSVSLVGSPLAGLNGLTAGSFNPSAGVIRVSWSDPNVTGVTVPDNATIYSVCFTAVAPANTLVPVNFGTASGFPVEVIKEPQGEVTPLLNNGHVFVSAVAPCTVTGSATNVTCPGGTNGAINLSVANSCPNRTFLWSNNSTQQNLTGLAAGSYTVTVTFTGGATQTATFNVTAPAAITATPQVTNVSCFGGTNGAISLSTGGGTGPYTYAWAGPAPFSSTQQNLTNLAAGAYTVTVRDVNNCSLVAPVVTVTQPNALTVPTNQTIVTNTCFGQSNGSINISVTGGTIPYTFAWTGPAPFTASTEDISNLAAGTYTVTVTDSRSCTFVNQGITVQAPSAALAVSLLSSQNVTCFGTGTGRAQISVTGGTGPYAYAWRTGTTLVSTAQNPNTLPAGTFNVTVTDAGNCTATLPAPVTINGPASALTLSNTQTNVQCPGGNNGSINLSANGGWGNPTVVWSPVIPGQFNPTGLVGGTYTATVTDQGGCSATQSITINAPAPIAIGTPQVANVTCANEGNGGIVISPTGGNGAPYNVIWNGSTLSGSAIGNLDGGSYTPVVSDALGCTAAFAAIQITEPPALTLDTNVVAQNGAQLGSIDLIVAGGAPSYTFAWVGPNPFTATTEDISGLNAGNYTVTVTDANACTISATYAVPQANVLAGATVTSVQNSCNNDGCVNIQLPQTAVGPFTVNWGTGTQQAAGTTVQVCNLPAGSYNITVTAPNGNTVTLQATITQLQAAIVNSNVQQPFDDSSNGSISLAPAFPGLTYAWSVPNQTGASVSGLDAGTYTVTVTNPSSGCTAVYNFTLTRQYLPYAASATVTNSNCTNNATGAVNLTVSGGDGPTYSYLWAGPNNFSATTQDLNNVAPGTYTVTVTDESGVARTTTATVQAQSLLAITNVNETSIYPPANTQVSAADICNGAANVVFSGGVGNVSILWSNNATTAATSTLCGGAYSVTVTDGLGCTAVWTDALTAPPALSSNSQVSTPVSCNGACNGAARVFASGGVAPYTVRWSTGQQEPIAGGGDYSEAVNLCGGTYSVTLTDINGATRVFAVEVPEPAPIVVEFSDPIEPNTFNSCDGQLFANVSGALEPLNIIWAGSLGNDGSGPQAEGLCANEVVQFIITDANNCVAIVTDTVPYPEDGCLQVRPVITPGDQDGNNDYLQITCTEQVEDRVEIFNRWGQLVFQTDNYENNDDVNPTSSTTWYGLNRNGQPYAEGVYYYVITYTDVQGNDVQRKGYLNLLR